MGPTAHGVCPDDDLVSPSPRAARLCCLNTSPNKKGVDTSTEKDAGQFDEGDAVRSQFYSGSDLNYDSREVAKQRNRVGSLAERGKRYKKTGVFAHLD